MDEQVIPIPHVANVADTVAWYERLGFTVEWENRIDPGWPAFVSIARGQARVFLSEHRGDARPDTLVWEFVSDIAPVVAEFGRPAHEPPYGCEIELRDPDGNRLRISTARDGWAGVGRRMRKGSGDSEEARTPDQDKDDPVLPPAERVVAPDLCMPPGPRWRLN
jgi:hypothetical protein